MHTKRQKVQEERKQKSESELDKTKMLALSDYQLKITMINTKNSNWK